MKGSLSTSSLRIGVVVGGAAAGAVVLWLAACGGGPPAWSLTLCQTPSCASTTESCPVANPAVGEGCVDEGSFASCYYCEPDEAPSAWLYCDGQVWVDGTSSAAPGLAFCDER